MRESNTEKDSSHNQFSISALRRSLNSMPALIVALPLVLGILLYDVIALPSNVTVIAMAVLLICAVWLRRGRAAVWLLSAAALLFGYLLSELQQSSCEIPYNQDLELVINVDEIPAERQGYNLSEGRIEMWRSDSVWYRGDAQVVLWLRADSVKEGDCVRVVGRIRDEMSRIDSYDRLLRARGFVGGVGVDDSSIVDLQRGDMSLHSRSVRKLERYLRDTASYATAEAMVVGSKRLMPQSLSESYSRTGLAHLMAVSGLHLGIVMLVIGSLLRPLVLIHRGYQLCSLLIIVLLWVYVFVVGASASVVRAALMFSVLQLGMITSKHYSSLNALLVAVIAMVVYRTDYVFDISFQLSVVAVVGIIVWGVPLMRHLSAAGRGAWWLLSTIAISIVATLWTLPIVSYSFANIPLVGVIITPVAMLLSYVIIGCGLFVLLLPHPVAQPFAWVMEYASWLENLIVERVACLPLASIEYRMSEWQIVVIYAVYLLITLFIWSRSEKK